MTVCTTLGHASKRTYALHCEGMLFHEHNAPLKTKWPVPPGNITRRAQWSMIARVAVAIAAAAACAITAVLILHGVNRFPLFLAHAEQTQRDGATVWKDVCKYGTVLHPTSLVRCTDALADANSSPRKIAIERTIADVFSTAERLVHSHVGTLNPLAWLAHNCATGTVCHYVSWKSLDVITSSVFVMTALALVAIALLFYVCWIRPAEGVKRWLELRRLDCTKRGDDELPHTVSMTQPTYIGAKGLQHTK